MSHRGPSRGTGYHGERTPDGRATPTAPVATSGRMGVADSGPSATPPPDSGEKGGVAQAAVATLADQRHDVAPHALCALHEPSGDHHGQRAAGRQCLRQRADERDPELLPRRFERTFQSANVRVSVWNRASASTYRSLCSRLSESAAA
jgi:hypothetical protein